MQFKRQISDVGTADAVETVQFLADTIDLGRDGSMYGIKLVEVSSVAGADFDIAFQKWAITDLTTATGSLDPVTNPNAYFKYTSTGGDFVFNFTTWNYTDGAAWAAGTEDVWIVCAKPITLLSFGGIQLLPHLK
jgi:hypothetical protein